MDDREMLELTPPITGKPKAVRLIGLLAGNYCYGEKDMVDMTDSDLIGYCNLHCETPRALFIGRHINRMLALAGHPDGFVRKVPDDEWISVHEPMKELCSLARQRMTANAKVSGAGTASAGLPG